MNYSELQTAIIDDTHKPAYAGALVRRFIEQAEALIASRLEAYNFLTTLLDANRVVAAGPRYAISGVTNIRYVRIDGLPLDRVDETTILLNKNAARPLVYVPRASEIQIAANPAIGTVIDFDYMGKPPKLTDAAPNNTLLTDYPQLYIESASVYVFKHAQDIENSDLSMTHFVNLCAEINRVSKKLLGGAAGAPVYNTQFRSSY